MFSIKNSIPAMKTYTVIVSKTAILDLNDIATFVAGLYRPESGHNYVNRILGKLASFSYTADIFPKSRFKTALNIHHEAKNVSIINHRWTVVFHIEKHYAMINRIIPSKIMI